MMMHKEWSQKFWIVGLSLLLMLSMGLPAQAYHFPWDQGHDTTDWNDPKKPGTEDDPVTDSCNGTSSPVYTRTGHFIWSETDVVLKGRPIIELTRTYNSNDPRDGSFGNGWTGRCEIALYYTNRSNEENQYILRWHDGKRYTYNGQSDGSFIAPEGRFDEVVRQSDGAAHLIAPDGSRIEFAANGSVTARINANGVAVNYSYDAITGLLNRISDANGRYLQLSYNSGGRTSTVTDHTGRVWSYSYDVNGNLTEVSDPLAGRRGYQYQAYQPTGDNHVYYQLTKITDAGDVTISEITYNRERVQTYTEGENRYTYSHNATSKTVTKTDRVGSAWTYVYNDHGLIVSERDPLGHTVSYQHDVNGRVTKITDELGNQFDSTYDALGRLTSNSDTLGSVVFEYQADYPWVSKITSKSGRSVQFIYDDKGNVTDVTDPSGALTKMQWNSQGDLVSLTDALGNATQQTVNAIGQPLTITDALNRTVQFEYDARFNLTLITDPLGNATTFEYDQLDRMVKQTNALGHVTLFSYDVASRLLSVTAPNNESVSYQYDSYGRRITRIDYDGVEEVYTYRADNLLSQSHDRANIATTYTYNLAKQLTNVNVGGETTVYTYTALGQLNAATNATGTVNFIYDALGRVTSESNNGQTISYTYNSESELISYSAFGKTWNYNYDQRGLLTQIAAPQGNFDFQYDQLGRRTSLAMPNGSQTTYSFDAASQLTTQQHSGIFSALYQYQYDNVGRMSSWSGDGTPKSYEYDAISRLTRAVDSFSDTAYSYDELGNHTNNAQTHDAANRLLDDADNSYTYDANGNLIQKQNKTTAARTVYSWNKQGQLIKLEQFADGVATVAASTTTFAYGPLGRRWERTKDGVTERFVYSGQDRIGDLDGTNTLVANVTFGPNIDEPLGLSKGGSDYVYHTNHQGSITALTDASQVVSSYQYGPFGSLDITGDSAINLFGYTGREYEGEVLHYFRARYFDPDIRRFISSDPVGISDGVNTYSYVGNSPLNYVDPSGNGKVSIARKAWNHIFKRHVKRGIYKNKGKFSKPKSIKKYVDKTVNNPDRVTKQSDGRILYEKKMGGKIGKNGEQYMRVVTDKNGNVVTAFPSSGLKTAIPGANLGSTLFGAGFAAQCVDLVNPLNDVQSILDMIEGYD